ncbi:hypothetical protein JCM31826_01530 [Thermaurantimonas aggregans]|uniref:HTH cro/C1-type domain-containing protein n=1 Tax=Thermaurantimonas aggregans TaxID=2173829 RepID=A0A401XI52_9FLAO|nr:S24 family peptidase [Thermaurantimonas aggregans]GCD76671.1 hypothetical protein JCM31826_01530 [Thermaurantimonas aggregans]
MEYYKYKSLNEFAIKGLKYKSPEKLNRLKDPKNKPSVEILIDISNMFDINIDWLLTGRGPMLRDQVPQAVPSPTGVPLIPAEALAGYGAGELVITEHMIEHRYVIPEFRSATCIIRVKGDSMSPTYLPGDMIAIKKIDAKTFIQWNKPHVLDTVQGILIKRVLQSESGYILRSDNPSYPDITVPSKEVYNMYLILGLIRFE